MVQLRNVPVAQLDRAPDYGFGGWKFDSSQDHINLFSFAFLLLFYCFFILLFMIQLKK